ncbi:hypothetical protein ACLOJK_005527 [Asimina triloba]
MMAVAARWRLLQIQHISITLPKSGHGKQTWRIAALHLLISDLKIWLRLPNQQAAALVSFVRIADRRQLEPTSDSDNMHRPVAANQTTANLNLQTDRSVMPKSQRTNPAVMTA